MSRRLAHRALPTVLSASLLLSFAPAATLAANANAAGDAPLAIHLSTTANAYAQQRDAWEPNRLEFLLILLAT